MPQSQSHDLPLLGIPRRRQGTPPEGEILQLAGASNPKPQVRYSRLRLDVFGNVDQVARKVEIPQRRAMGRQGYQRFDRGAMRTISAAVSQPENRDPGQPDCELLDIRICERGSALSESSAPRIALQNFEGTERFEVRNKS